jgi:hypothetical protein
MAIDVAVPFREEITEDRSELSIMDEGIEVWDGPPANSTYPVQGLVMHSLHDNLQFAPNIWDELLFESRICGSIRGFLVCVKEGGRTLNPPPDSRRQTAIRASKDS